MGPRRLSRELALQLLFQQEFDKDFELVSAFQRFVRNFDVAKEVVEYGRPLLDGIVGHRTELDAIIQEASPHWKVARMGTVDRNILRIAVYELIHESGQVPPKVAINEAIELGKRFGNTDSSAFINGILDQIAKSRRLVS